MAALMLKHQPRDRLYSIINYKYYLQSMLQRLALSLLLTALLFSGSIARSEPKQPERQINPRFFQLAKNQKTCPPEGFCYRFQAIVDVSDGYLRAYGFDEDGKRFVFGKMYAGETIRVDKITKIDGIWYAEFGTSRIDCAQGWCPGFVDLRYLR
jgi:hypothetical protein